MHQEAFPGEDISDRPPPEESVPGLLALIEGDLPSGRYRARELAGGDGVTRGALAFELPPRSRPPRRPRPAGSRATRSACWSPGAATAGRARAFRDLPRLLAPGDLLVVNTSATLPAALSAGGRALRSRPRRPTASRHWVVELRDGTTPTCAPAAATVCSSRPAVAPPPRPVRRRRRLWLARSSSGRTSSRYLDAHGHPIRYRYVPRAWPLPDYQTVFALQDGSVQPVPARHAIMHEVRTRTDP